MQVLTKFCCFGQSMDFADNPKYVKRVTLLPAALPFLANAESVASWQMHICKNSTCSDSHALARWAMLLSGYMGILSGIHRASDSL